MEDKKLIGVDLGGTKIHAALVAGHKVQNNCVLPTPANTTRDELLAQIKNAIEKVYDKGVKGIGIGSPGQMDFKTGTILKAVNLRMLEGVSLKDSIGKMFEVPVFVNNDANCFVLGEKYFGSAKGFDDVIAITLGTGLGGGIILNGKLYAGQNAGAGEFGVIKYRDKDFEYYCSSGFFAHKYKTSGLETSTKAENGDNKALQIFEELGQNIGELIYMLLAVYDPQIIVIGGSIAGSKKYIVDGIYKVLHSFYSQEIIKKLKIEFNNQPNAAVLGAAALYFDNFMS